jgi:hypothetical protein
MPNAFEKIAQKEKEKALAKQNADAERFAKKVADEVTGSIGDLSFKESIAELATNLAKAISLSNDATDKKLGDSFSLLLDAVRENKTSETQIELSLKIGEQLAAIEGAFAGMEAPVVNVEGISIDDLRAEIAKIIQRLPADSQRIVTLAYEDATPDKYLNVRLTNGLQFYEARGGGGGGGGDISAIKGFALGQYDTIEAAYPSSTTETYTYKLDGETIATITVSYSDSTKTVLTSVVKS